ncbi:MAG: hypothetical protein MK135_03460 [Polyangiaceae bacterium]|nr:hypothetical protein [Polyangiaceae bacterium]
MGKEGQAREELALERLSKLHQSDLPFLRPSFYQLLVPPKQAANCVGELSASPSVACASTFLAWEKSASEGVAR